MSDHKAVLGSAAWVQQTHGWMTAAERRSLMGPLARTHLSNAVGRLRMAVRLRALLHLATTQTGVLHQSD
jgi:hypothetical protein